MNETSWLHLFRPLPLSQMRLFCFSYAGGGPMAFRRWPSRLPPEIELNAVLLPGRERRLREPLFHRIEPLVQTLIEAILPRLDRPFAFFGHSMGALVSFECARQLRRLEAPLPCQLFFSGFRAPQHPIVLPGLHHLPDNELLDKLRLLNGTPEWVLNNGELMRMILPTIRADFEVCDTYRYVQEAPFDIPVSVFGGLDDRLADQKTLGDWAVHTQRTFSLQMFPGGHFYIQSASRAPLLKAIVELLSV